MLCILHKRGLWRHAMSVCPSVTFVYSVETNYIDSRVRPYTEDNRIEFNCTHGHSGLTQRTSAVYAIWWWWSTIAKYFVPTVLMPNNLQFAWKKTFVKICYKQSLFIISELCASSSSRFASVLSCVLAIKPGTHWRQSWIQHERIRGVIFLWRCVIINWHLHLHYGRLCWESTESTVSLWPRTHRQQSRPYRQQSWLCCRFVAGFGNSQLGRQCVPGFRITKATCVFCSGLWWTVITTSSPHAFRLNACCLDGPFRGGKRIVSAIDFCRGGGDGPDRRTDVRYCCRHSAKTDGRLFPPLHGRPETVSCVMDPYITTCGWQFDLVVMRWPRSM